MGSRALSKIQYGKETVAGTPVAADTMIVGGSHPPISPDRIPRRPEENLGLKANSMRSWLGQNIVQDTMTFEDSYFELLPILFSSAFVGGQTATEVTASQSDYGWTFTPSLTATNSLDTGTWEMGDDTQAYEVEYVLFERIAVSGSINQGAEASPVQIQADYFGRKWNTITAFTSDLSLPSVEPINAKLAQFYRDTSWAGVGGTEVTGLLRDFNIEFITGLHPKFFGDSDKSFSTHGEGPFAVRAEFTFEGSSDADDIWDLMNSQALSVIRLNILGSTIASGTPHQLQIDIGGTWEDVVPLSGEDRDNNLHTAVLVGQYDTTGAKLFAIEVVTTSAAI